MSKFQVYKDKKGETRFRFLASNGEPMFASEGYKTKASAMKAIETIKQNASAAAIEEMAEAAKKAAAKAPAKDKAPAKAATVAKSAGKKVVSAMKASAAKAGAKSTKSKATA